MWEWLQRLDWVLLGWVEAHLHSSWLDFPMRVLSDLRYFVPLLVALGIWLLFKGGDRGRRFVFAAAVLVLVTDQLSATVLRPLIGRSRPYSESFGLPSSHATNIFAQAFLVCSFYRHLAIPAFLMASLVGFSRVYLGKHFPFDVLSGAVVGILCGALVVHSTRRYEQRIDQLWASAIEGVLSRVTGSPRSRG